jgi:hypothetical protein
VQTARFIQALQTHARVRIVPASQVLLGRGLEFYGARPDKEWSLTDCISFLVMSDESMPKRSRATGIFSKQVLSRCCPEVSDRAELLFTEPGCE